MARTALVSALGLMKRCTFVHLFPPRYSSNCISLYTRFNEKVRFRQFFSDRHSVPDTVSGGFSGFGADFGTDRSFPVRFLPWGRER